jgi:DNA-binding response OmpR family regulator
VTRKGEPLQLSRIAFDLLLALASKPGQVVAREDLMREVWGYDKDVVSRTLDTHIFDLRRLIEPDPTHPRHIVTVWRIGYRFTP